MHRKVHAAVALWDLLSAAALAAGLPNAHAGAFPAVPPARLAICVLAWGLARAWAATATGVERRPLLRASYALEMALAMAQPRPRQAALAAIDRPRLTAAACAATLLLT